MSTHLLLRAPSEVSAGDAYDGILEVVTTSEIEVDFIRLHLDGRERVKLPSGDGYTTLMAHHFSYWLD